MKIGAKKLGWALANNVVDIAIGVGVIGFATRFYPASEAGLWVLFTTFVFLATRLREGLIQTALVKFAAESQGASHHQYLKAGFVACLVIDSVFCLVFLFAAISDLAGELTPFLYAYPAMSLPMALYRWQTFAFQSKLKVDLIFKTGLVVLLMLSAGLTAIAVYGLPVYGLAFAMGLAMTTGLITGAFFFPWPQVWSARISGIDLGPLLLYARHGFYRELTGTLSSRANIYLSPLMIGLEGTALVGVAQRFTQLMNIPVMALQSLLFPKACDLAAKNDQPATRKMFETAISGLLALLLPFVIALSVFAAPVIDLVNGESYLAAAPVMIIMVLTVALFTPFGTSFGSLMNSKGRPDIVTKVVATMAVANIVICTGFIWGFGLIGTAIGPLISEFIGFLWIAGIMRGHAGIRVWHCLVQIPFQYGRWIALARHHLPKASPLASTPKSQIS